MAAEDFSGAVKYFERILTEHEKRDDDRVEHLDDRFEALEKLALAAVDVQSKRTDEGDQRLRDHISSQITQISAALDSARRETAQAAATQKESTEKALVAATALSEAHNGLIRKMEKQSETFALKETVNKEFSRIESWQARLTGGIVILFFIGITNLVKLWIH